MPAPPQQPGSRATIRTLFRSQATVAKLNALRQRHLSTVAFSPVSPPLAIAAVPSTETPPPSVVTAEPALPGIPVALDTVGSPLLLPLVITDHRALHPTSPAQGRIHALPVVLPTPTPLGQQLAQLWQGSRVGLNALPRAKTWNSRPSHEILLAASFVPVEPFPEVPPMLPPEWDPRTTIDYGIYNPAQADLPIQAEDNTAIIYFEDNIPPDQAPAVFLQNWTPPPATITVTGQPRYTVGPARGRISNLIQPLRSVQLLQTRLSRLTQGGSSSAKLNAIQAQGRVWTAAPVLPLSLSATPIVKTPDLSVPPLETAPVPPVPIISEAVSPPDSSPVLVSPVNNLSPLPLPKVIAAPKSTPATISLAMLFWTFLTIGSTAFGGFMALIAVIESVIVGRRKLLDHDDMLDGISLATVLPGPIAVNVVAYIGYRLRGAWGAVTTVTAVLLPSFVLVVGLTMFYLQAGQIPAVDKVFQGFIPAVAAIILSTAWGMSQKAIKNNRRKWGLALGAALVLASAQLPFLKPISFYLTLGLVIGAGVIGHVWFRDPSPAPAAPTKIALRSFILPIVILGSLLFLYLVPLPILGQNSLLRIFVTFSGMSLLLFGGGYVFIPLLQTVVVNTLGWVTPDQFTSAIAMGQVTPGPILISAAFIGYVVQGLLGAFVATTAIFGPPALLMVSCSRVLQQIKSSPMIQSVLQGIRPAVVGMIFTAALIVLASSKYLGGWITYVIFALTLWALQKLKLEVVLIIPAAGILGLLLYD